MKKQNADRGGRTPKADPLKVEKLAELLQQRAWTYAELEQHPELELKRRSLQTYVKRHLPAAGYKPEVSTDGVRGEVLIRLPTQDAGDRQAVERALRALARGMMEGFFPIEGTDFGRPVKRSPVLVIASGRPVLTEAHRRALMHWINASSFDPPRPVQIRYRAPADPDEGALRTRTVWPLGVIFRDGRRVYLPALTEDATSLRDRRLFALERVVPGPRDCGVTKVDARIAPPEFLVTQRPELTRLVEPGFGVVLADAKADRVTVHVRFDARQAGYVRGRQWHRKQRERVLDDGAYELTFGPVDLREAVGWCSQWIEGITVLGDERLRRAYVESLEARIKTQRAVAPSTPAE